MSELNQDQTEVPKELTAAEKKALAKAEKAEAEAKAQAEAAAAQEAAEKAEAEAKAQAEAEAQQRAAEVIANAAAAAKKQVDADAAAQADVAAKLAEAEAAEAVAKAARQAALDAQAALNPDQAKPELVGQTGTAESELSALQLRVFNTGDQRAMCHVTRALIPAKTSVVINYANARDKALAKGNFAQINALKGMKRFEVEG